MTQPELTSELDLKLKARLGGVDDLNYTLQVYPSNVEWKYLESEGEYAILGHKFKNETIRQIVRNVLLKSKDMIVGSIRTGSKDFLFEVQTPKGTHTDKIKDVFSLVTSNLKNEISRSRVETETFKKFLDDSEF